MMTSNGTPRISWALLFLILQLVTAAVAQLQIHVDLPAPSSTVGEELHDGQLRAHLLNQAHKAAASLKNLGPGDELSLLSARIKELKQQNDPEEETKESIKKLEQQRILLLRQGMLKRQFQMPPERINT
jgi:hypothetical protein